MPKMSKSPASTPLTGTIVETELFYLKLRNAELAKALAESKDAYTKSITERDYLQRELFGANLKIQKLLNVLNIIDGSGRSGLARLVEASKDLTEIIGTIHNNVTSNNVSQSPQVNRTPNGLPPPQEISVGPIVTVRRNAPVEHSFTDENNSGNANLMENANINNLSANSFQLSAVEKSHNKLQTIREEAEDSFNSPESSFHPPPLVRHSEIPILSGLYAESGKIHSTINQKRGGSRKRGNSSINSPNLRISSPPIKKQFVENIDDRLEVEMKSFVISCSQTAELSHSYNPLEGPSTLLEPEQEISDQFLRLSSRKLQTSTPQEPTDRHMELSDESQTPKKFITTRNVRMSPRVVLPRISLDELKKIETRREKSEPSTSKRRTIRVTRSKKKQSNENNVSSDKLTNTKATFKVNERKSVVVKESPKSTCSTPSISSNSSTPRRPRRKAVAVSLKEVSLKTKLRRSR